MMRALVVWLFFASTAVHAAVFCVRPAPTGNADGSDWNNAFGGIPSSRVRGSTYYIAGGDYILDAGGISLNDVESSTASIRFVRATAAAHGPDAGWSSALATETSARFLNNGTGSGWGLAPLHIRRSYYEFDGLTFGFTEHSCVDSNQAETSFLAVGLQAFDYSTAFHSIHFRGCEFFCCGDRDKYFGSDDGIYLVAQQNLVDLRLEDCWIHDVARSALVMSRQVEDVLIDGLRLERIGSNEEACGIRFDVVNGLTVRNSVFSDVQSTHISVHSASSDIDIYNNVFMRTSAELSWTNVGTTVIGVAEASNGVHIVHNLFANLRGLDVGIEVDSGSSDVVIRNNVWAHNVVNTINIQPASARDFNSFCGNWRDRNPGAINIDDSIASAETNSWSCSNNPAQRLFIHYSPGMSFDEADLHPFSSSPSAAPVEFTSDFYGVPRTVRSRGPFEYQGACPSSSSSCPAGDVCNLPSVCSIADGSCTLPSIKEFDGKRCSDATDLNDVCIDGSCAEGACFGNPGDQYAQYYGCDTMPSGGVCRFQCKLSNLPGTVTCQNSVWQTASVLCNNSDPCADTPVIAGTTLRSCSRIRGQTTCVYYCASGGDQLVYKCEDGIWRDETYGVSCGTWTCKTNPNFAGYSMTEVCAGAASGTTCTSVSCTWSGSVSTFPVCQADGSWSAPAGCLAAEPSCGFSNCEICATASSCKKCISGWTGSTCSTKACSIASCDVCDSPWTCKTCASGTLPSRDHTACSAACSSIPECTECGDGGVCTACTRGSLSPPNCTAPSCAVADCTECSWSGVCNVCSGDLVALDGGTRCGQVGTDSSSVSSGTVASAALFFVFAATAAAAL